MMIHPNKTDPDDFQIAIEALRVIPDGLGKGLESEVVKRVSEKPASSTILTPWFAVSAVALILIAGVSTGLYRGQAYEARLAQEHEQRYVASIHPLVATNASHAEHR